MTIRKRAGLADVRLHDLRHSFAKVGLAGGAAIAFIRKLLGPKRLATTERYAHLSGDPLKATADHISQAVAAQMEGRKAGTAALIAASSLSSSSQYSSSVSPVRPCSLML